MRACKTVKMWWLMSIRHFSALFARNVCELYGSKLIQWIAKFCISVIFRKTPTSMLTFIYLIVQYTILQNVVSIHSAAIVMVKYQIVPKLAMIFWFPITFWLTFIDRKLDFHLKICQTSVSQAIIWLNWDDYIIIFWSSFFKNLCVCNAV